MEALQSMTAPSNKMNTDHSEGLLFEQVLADYHKRMLSEDALIKTLPVEEGMLRRDEFLLAVGEDAARFLNMLVKSANSQVILELGTSYGYSTLWLAEAARSTNGKVISFELDSAKADVANKQLKKAKLGSFVDIRVGDALELLHQLQVHPDFVLIDLWKELYVPCFEIFLPRLNPGAIIVADNMIFPPSHKENVLAYQKVIRETKAFDSILLPIGSGLEVSKLKAQS